MFVSARPMALQVFFVVSYKPSVCPEALPSILWVSGYIRGLAGGLQALQSQAGQHPAAQMSALYGGG